MCKGKMINVHRMKELGVESHTDSVVFGQLMGMCDHVTFQLGKYLQCYRALHRTLGSLGYMAFKYMPYGPVQEVLPYLQRRAHENKGFLKGAMQERHLITSELKRRLTNK